MMLKMKTLKPQISSPAHLKGPKKAPNAFGTNLEHIANMLNPEPLPYQINEFKSCTKLKMVKVQKRHAESFASSEQTAAPNKQKGVILHTERYSFDEPKRSLDMQQASQRDRLLLEQDLVERAKGMKRRRELLSHRARHELALGGERLGQQQSIRDIDMNTHFDNPPPPLSSAMQFTSAHLPLSNPPRIPTPPQRHELPTSAPVGAVADPTGGTWLADVGTASMGVQRAKLYEREGTTFPPPLTRPERSQVPHLPRLRPAFSDLGSVMSAIVTGQKPQKSGRGLADILTSGKPAKFNERADIATELNRLKSIVLPECARDLYIGRGIKLPKNHATLMPRRAPPKTPEPVRASTFRAKSELSKIGSTTVASSVISDAEDLKTFEEEVEPDEKEEEKKEEEEKEEEKKEEEKKEEEEKEEEVVAEEATQDPPPPPSAATRQRTDDNMLRRPETGSVEPTEHRNFTPNPLEGAMFKDIHPDLSEDTLFATFKRLDTDMDGHLAYPEVRTGLPKDLTPGQERFIKAVYDCTANSTFFGHKEFALLRQLSECSKKLPDNLRQAYEEIGQVDLSIAVTKFTEHYAAVDRSLKGVINADSMKTIIDLVLDKDLAEDEVLFQKVNADLNLESRESVDKLDFLSWIPYIISLNPNQHSQVAFQRAKTILEG